MSKFTHYLPALRRKIKSSYNQVNPEFENLMTSFLHFSFCFK